MGVSTWGAARAQWLATCPSPPFSRAVFLPAHSPVMGHRSGHCAKCGSHASGTDTILRQWLLSPCGGTEYSVVLIASAVRPASVLEHMMVRVAGKVLHSSHHLKVYRHLYYCTTCGKVAGCRVQQLGATCAPLGAHDYSGRQVPTGVRNLRRLAEGQLPQGSPFWPDAMPLALRGHTLTL